MSEALYGAEPAQQLIDAVTSVRRYNMSVMMPLGGMFTGLIDPAETPQPTVGRIDESAMARGVTTGLHTHELAEMGVELFDPNATIETQSDAPKAPIMLTMRIADSAKFSQMIQGLAPHEDQLNAVQDGVNEILATSSNIVYMAYGPNADPTTRDAYRVIADEQLSMFADLSPVLVANGFDKIRSYTNLTDCLIHHQAGTLTDYIDAAERGLMWTADQFGPGGWQTDSTGEELFSRWQQTFDYLRSLRDRNPPSPFYSELFAKLRHDFDASWAGIDAVPADEPFLAEQRRAMAQLNKIWEQDFQLENSFYLA